MNQDLSYGATKDIDGNTRPIRRGFFDFEVSDEHKAFILDALAEYQPLMITVIDAKTGKCVYVSAGWEELTGMSVSHLLDDPLAWVEMIHPEDRTYSMTEFMASRTRSAGGADVRVLHQDNTIHWVNSWQRPVFDADGKLMLIIGLTQEITERKRLELDLREAHVELEQRIRKRTLELEHVTERLENALDELQLSKDAMSEGLIRYRRLTAREKDVFECLVEGGSNKSISEQLEITVATVKVHRARVMKKMETSSAAELAILAVRSGLVSSTPTPD